MRRLFYSVSFVLDVVNAVLDDWVFKVSSIRFDFTKSYLYVIIMLYIIFL